MKLLKKIKDIYRIDKVSYIEIAQAMDFINEYTIKCYCNYIDGEACPHTIQSKLYKRNKKLNSVVFQFAIDIMTKEKYIATESVDGDSTSVKNFLYTKKGIEKYFQGGFMKELKKKRREKWLMITGQFSIILAGLYYLLELLKIFCPE